MAFPVLPKGALPEGQRPEDSFGGVLPRTTAGGDRAANARNEVALVVLDQRVTSSDTSLAIESE